MRIKRQRRKLRGKYSGNCLSCAAKWSKCWYIASAENQEEWEARLSMTVTPADDEVCFQCWDAKIRTSPKRKMNFKAEIPALDAILSDDIPYLRPAKRTNGNKRQALNEEYSQYSRLQRYTEDSPSPNLDSKNSFYDDAGSDYSNESNDLVDDDDLDSFSQDVQEDNELYSEGVRFEEESAVMLLSSGFRTISPDQNIVSANNAYEANLSEEEDGRSKKRAVYTCSKCGQQKKGHTCAVASPSDLSSSMSSPLSSSTEGLSPDPILTHTHAQVSFHATLQSVAYQIQGVDVLPVMLAQPVFS